MKKVYCKNCIWYKLGFFYPECWLKAAYYETDKSNKHYPNIIYQDYLHKVEADLELNRENKCAYYKRKWYLFYIK